MQLRKGWSLAWGICAFAAAIIFIAHAAMAQGTQGRTIRMWTFLNPVSGKTGREAALKQLMDGFEASHPGVKIQVEPQDYRTMTNKFFAAAQTGVAPDVMWILSPQIYDAINAGTLANLDDLFVKHWTKDQIADIDGPFWRYGAKPGAHYQLFSSPSIHGQLYRTDLFEQAGINPASLTTWEKLFAAAEKLTVRDANGKVTRWGFGQPNAGAIPISSLVFVSLLDLNGTLFDSKFRAAFANPAGIAGLRMVLDTVEKYKITPPDMVTLIQDDAVDQFGAGRYAILRASTPRIEVAARALGPGKVGYLPTPSFTSGKTAPTNCTGWAVGIWSGSKIKELAGEWLEYMLGQQADSVWLTKGGQTPLWKSTLPANAAFIADPSNAYMTAVMKDMPNCWLPPEAAGPGGWNEALDVGIQDAIIHHTDPKTALEEAEAAFNRGRH